MSNEVKFEIKFWVIIVLLFGSVGAYLGMTETPNPTLENSIETTIDNVVYIRNNSGRCQGSGVLLKPGLILTARHVVENGEDFEVKLNDGTVYKANRAVTSKTHDLGFIKLDIEDDLPECTTQIGTIKDCRLGQTVYAIGSPYGDIHQNSVTAGIVSSLARKLEDFDCPKAYGWSATWQTDAAGHPGNSGCPVYTLDGKVVGILVGGYSNALIYCIPAELVTEDCQAIELMFLMDNYILERDDDYNSAVYDFLNGVIN